MSYASQDAEAARRICDSLRAAGVEVWFDQSELVGGDAWDAKIRGQLAECALFVPIISANTQARLEGYFRIEWKLAAQRTHAMAEEKTFLLPVVIDDTRDSDAKVPAEFRAVQWTRFVSDESLCAFCEHAKVLLLGDPGARASLSAPPAVRPGTAAVPSTLSRLRWLAIGSAAAAAIVAVAFWQPWKNAASVVSATTEAAAAAPISETGVKKPVSKSAAAQPPTDLAPAKSVAVLAFANLSDDKANEYFSDGISEELLNVLAKIPGLKVSARTSAFHFKGKDTPIPEIAKQLGVAYVVEGSVRKAGPRVRITAQLISATDGFHLWSDNFDRELKDIFAVQEEIAGLIAKNLQLKLGAPARMAKAVNPEAHRLILEGRHFWRLRTDDGFVRAETNFKRAAELDPRWAPTHAALADLWAIRALYRLLDGAPFEEDVARARAAAARALELDPDLADPHGALGLLSTIVGRVSEARLHFEKALALAPNHAQAHDWLGDLEQSTGRLDHALQEYRTAARLDPLSPFILNDLGRTLPLARRFAEALEMLDRAEALQPGRVRLGAWRAYVLLELGRRPDAGAALQAVLPKLRSGREDGGEVGWLVVYVLRALGRDTEAREVSAGLLQAMKDGRSRGAVLRFALGETEQALALIERSPNTTTIAQYLFWHPMFDPIREQPRFQQMLVKLGLADQYKVARETLARMLKEPAVAKPRADKQAAKQ